jgi:hypothetical protein
MPVGHGGIRRVRGGLQVAGAGGADHQLIDREAILRNDRAVVGGEKGLGQQQQQFIGAIAHRQPGGRHLQMRGQRLLELV